MKLGIAFVIIGCLLIGEGMVRVYLGFVQAYSSLIFGGFLTGLGLGGLLLFFGIRRLIKQKVKHESQPKAK